MSFTPASARPDASVSNSLFPSNLRFLRKRRNLNQEDISALFNKKANTVGNWENGKTEPSIPELLKISGYFGVNLEDLLRSELRQQQADRERQLTLWPEPVERIPGMPAMTPGQAALPQDTAVNQSAPPNNVALSPVSPSIGQPDSGEKTSKTTNNPGTNKKELITYNNDRAIDQAEGPARPAAPLPQTLPAAGGAANLVPAGDAMWFMLRELRSVQERLDELQSAFERSRTYRTADKSDH